MRQSEFFAGTPLLTKSSDCRELRKGSNSHLRVAGKDNQATPSHLEEEKTIFGRLFAGKGNHG